MQDCCLQVPSADISITISTTNRSLLVVIILKQWFSILFVSRTLFTPKRNLRESCCMCRVTECWHTCRVAQRQAQHFLFSCSNFYIVGESGDPADPGPCAAQGQDSGVTPPTSHSPYQLRLGGMCGLLQLPQELRRMAEEGSGGMDGSKWGAGRYGTPGHLTPLIPQVCQ